MKALVWHGNHDFRIENVPQPKAGPGQILVRVEAAAICQSDFHMDNFGAKPPLILGHEVAGVVVEVGEDVGHLAVGDRVAIDPVQRCGKCWCCNHGIEHMCLNARHLGDHDVAGGWAEFVAVDRANGYRIPEGVDFPAACLAEPAAVCYHSFRRARFQPGQNVLIIGDGPFGFLHAQIAGALGAAKIIVAGHYDARLRRIVSLTNVIPCNTHSQEMSEVLANKVGFPGVDVVIEATGANASVNLGIKALRPRGTIVIFSYIWKPEPLQMELIHLRELNILGACRSINAYGPSLDMLGEGKIDTSTLIDLQIPLQDYRLAMEKLVEHKAEVFKAILLPQAVKARNSTPLNVRRQPEVDSVVDDKLDGKSL